MTSKTKKWSSAPLPFKGQKRNFASTYRQVLKLYPECTAIVDLFGGSGLLARISKDERPDARVIFNDFDNFADRVRNIQNTNRLLHAFRDVVAGLKRHSLIPKEKKDAIVSILEKETGFVDYVSISSSLLFSMEYETSLEGLKKQPFYNRVRLNDYKMADDYLEGIEIVKGDYKDIFDKYKDEKNVLWLVDPPYLSTDCTTYNNHYWKLGDYLDVLRVLQGTSYVYFTSNKSSFVELCEWLGDGCVTANPFVGAKMITVKENANYHASYLDIMMYKRKETV
jgi:site-specific DNA-adenine methylase